MFSIKIKKTLFQFCFQFHNKYFVLLGLFKINFNICAFQDCCPKNASYYSNRSAARMMLSQYKEALKDAQTAVQVDNQFAKVRYLFVVHTIYDIMNCLYVLVLDLLFLVIFVKILPEKAIVFR